MEQNNIVRFPFVEGKEFVDIDNIQYIESHKHKLNFVMANNSDSYSIYDKLDNVEEILKGYSFVRIHQSYLVNMRYINVINSYKMQLNNGIELSVPKKRYPFVKKLYAQYISQI